jgi:hypothetical protein
MTYHEFPPAEYAYIAGLLRRHMNKDNARFHAVLSNNLNIILAALDTAAGTTRQDLIDAISDRLEDRQDIDTTMRKCAVIAVEVLEELGVLDVSAAKERDGE